MRERREGERERGGESERVRARHTHTHTHTDTQTDRQINLPVWQVLPVNPGRHLQVKLPYTFRQDPPFWHGFG